MIPFESWDGKNDFSGTVEQSRLEQYFGSAAVVFGTYQAAISAILECLGTRSHLVPVILPVTASPDTLAGVLRAGGDPLLLDIRPQTLQMDPEYLRLVLAEVKAAVVVLTRPAGQPVDPALLEACGDNPTILDSRLPPGGEIRDIDKDSVCSFSVFDFAPIVGTGALVIHKFDQQLRELKIIRNGVLGLSGNMNDALAAYALKRLKEDPGLYTRSARQAQVAGTYLYLLKESHVLPFESSPEWPYFIVRVENADKVIAHLHREVQAVKPVFPLHMFSDVNRRWLEKPSYPVAEGLFQKLVAIPTHLGILGKESMIVSRLSEVSND